jgi:hypothetical protein
MSHASEYTAVLPEVPDTIRDRYVDYHDFDIEGYLQALEDRRPGLFDAMVRRIDILEGDSCIGEITIDVDEEDFLRPVTIWADSTFPTEEQEEQLLRFHGIGKDTLQYFNDLARGGGVSGKV